MATKRFIRVLVTATSNEEYPIEDLFPGAEDATEDEIDEWLDENAWELLEDDDWVSIDVDVRMFNREIDDE